MKLEVKDGKISVNGINFPPLLAVLLVKTTVDVPNVWASE
jgi:hypothetical protein